MRLALALLLLTTATQAQWQIQQSNTTADLRGIHSLGNGIAWASGSKGTVLHTTDNGTTWQPCAIPPGADALDFRGIQAFDARTAIVMSSGKGDLSRLYKTEDACKTWELIFTNPDASGFFDAISVTRSSTGRTDGRQIVRGYAIGDPVDGLFAEFVTKGADGNHWEKVTSVRGIDFRANEGESLFAASNSAVLWGNGTKIVVTGGTGGSRSRVLSEYVKHDPMVSYKYVGGDLPFARVESAGAFSIATSYRQGHSPEVPAEINNTVLYFPRDATCVVVGGDYKKPDQTKSTAAYTRDGGLHWRASTTPPHGYRSAVAYNEATKSWITVGPNGTDLSTDDGRNWHPLNPTADESQHWNALSLPFVVGPHGRIGLLRPDALSTPQANSEPETHQLEIRK